MASGNSGSENRLDAVLTVGDSDLHFAERQSRGPSPPSMNSLNPQEERSIPGILLATKGRLCFNSRRMRHDDYLQRKRALDERLRAWIELLEAAHRTEVRALETLWA